MHFSDFLCQGLNEGLKRKAWWERVGWLFCCMVDWWCPWCSYYKLLWSHNCLLAILNRVQMTYASSGSISHLKQNRASSFTYLNEETYLRQEFSFFGCPRVCSVCALAYQTLAVVSHHAPTLVPLIPLFHCFDVLMESFSLFLAHCTKIVRKIVHMAMQKVYFHTHAAPKHLESLKLVAHQESVILSFDIAKKIGHHRCKCIPCIQFCWLHCTDEGWIIQQSSYLRSI